VRVPGRGLYMRVPANASHIYFFGLQRRACPGCVCPVRHRHRRRLFAAETDRGRRRAIGNRPYSIRELEMCEDNFNEEKHRNIALNIFKQYNMNFHTAERAGGWTNAVWLNGDYALRLSKERGSDKIHRETERAKTFPSSVGYPKNIAVGISEGYEWSLSERIQGKVLSSVWDSFSWIEKTAAVKQIFNIMASVHSVAVKNVEHLTLKTAWYNAFDRNSSLAGIKRYVSKKLFTQKQGDVLHDILERFYRWNASVTPVLCHGDITTDNLLWHDGNVVSLLDFEHAVIAPCQLDIHSLVNLALIPYDEHTSKHVVLLNIEEQEIQNYVAEITPLFKPFLAKQSDKDLFVGYNVLFRQRFFEFWLKNPKGDIEQCDAYQMLLSISNGNNGYLSKLL